MMISFAPGTRSPIHMTALIASIGRFSGELRPTQSIVRPPSAFSGTSATSIGLRVSNTRGENCRQ